MSSDDNTPFVFSLAQLGQAFSTRDRGLRVLGDLQQEMFEKSVKTVTVDFTGVRTVSFSFVDALFGTLAQRAHDLGEDPPVATGMVQAVREQLEESLRERQLELTEPNVALTA